MAVEKEEKKEKKQRKKRAPQRSTAEIFNNIDYFVITSNGAQLLYFEGADLEGKSKTELQKMVGEKIGAGKWGYSFKKKNSPANYTGTIRGIVTNQASSKNTTTTVPDDHRMTNIEKQLAEIAKGMSKGTGFDIDMLLKMKGESWKIKEDYYEMVIRNQKEQIEQLKAELKNADSGEDNISLVDMMQAAVEVFTKFKAGNNPVG